MISSTFKLTGLNCEACIKIITKRLLAIPNVTSAEVKLNGEATITSDKTVNKEDVVNALAGLEYKVL